MHTSANLSLQYERKKTTNTINPAPYVLCFDGQFRTVFKEEEFNTSVKSLNQSPTLTFPETEMKVMKSTTRYKRLKVLDSDSE